MSKSQEKKSTFFPNYFQQNRHLKKIQIFRKYKVYFHILVVLNSRKIMKIMSTTYFVTPPYSQIMTPNQIFFSPHGVKLFFGKSHQRTIMQLQN